MIKKRLKDLEIKITELADYLQLSRTTLYKFIDAYDAKNRKEVNSSVLKLFDYIEKNELIGKRNVINYILTNMTTVTETDVSEVNGLIKTVKEYISNNPKSEKTQFIEKSVETNSFDIVIHYLMDICSLLKKAKLTEEEKEKINPYREIINIYKIKEE